MLFLLRLTFWLLLISLVVSGSREDNARLINSAEKTVKDVRGFCQRNPDVCEDAHVTMTSMLTKLRSGAELLQTWLASDEDKEGAAAARPPAQPAPPEGAQPLSAPGQTFRLVPNWQDSLNPADRRMPWRGPDRL